jgi:hypothetical protein
MRAVSICSLLCVVLIAMPAGATAQSRPSDPEADSPSGVVYELPVDRARKDAAPRRGSSRQDGGEDTNSGAGSPGGGSSGNGSSGSGTDGTGLVAGSNETSIRSENNFGTSSQVPGAEARGGRGDGARRGAGSGGSGAGEGAGGAVDGLGELAPSSAAGAAEGPSDGVVFLLLAALLGVGGLIGVAAGRRAARDRRA